MLGRILVLRDESSMVFFWSGFMRECLHLLESISQHLFRRYVLPLCSVTMAARAWWAASATILGVGWGNGETSSQCSSLSSSWRLPHHCRRIHPYSPITMVFLVRCSRSHRQEAQRQGMNQNWFREAHLTTHILSFSDITMCFLITFESSTSEFSGLIALFVQRFTCAVRCSAQKVFDKMTLWVRWWKWRTVKGSGD